MSKIIVSGLINIETTLLVEQFPIPYFPVTYPFHQINTTVAGVGFNIAKALKTLGNQVQLLSITGSDFYHELICSQMEQIGLSANGILPAVEKTAQSIILYDRMGKRQIYTDLKYIQEHLYPAVVFEQSFTDCDLCVLCNINFSRPFLAQAKARNISIACDVHAIQNLDDQYNQDFMRYADILFCSHENLDLEPKNFIHNLWSRFQTPICVVSMGAAGAMLGIKQQEIIEHFPAVSTRSIVNTVGAGDALFSAFLDGYLRGFSPQKALERSMVFASYKIGACSAADGFLSLEELADLVLGLNFRQRST